MNKNGYGKFKLSDFELNLKDKDLKDISRLDDKIKDVSLIGNEILGILGSDIFSMIPNSSITIRNKVNELATFFKEKCLHLYNNPDNNFPLLGSISWSIIIKDIKTLTDEYFHKFYQYSILLHKVQLEVLKLEKTGIIKKTTMGYEMLKDNKNLIDVCLNPKTIDELKKVVTELCDIDNKIFNYSLEKDLILGILNTSNSLLLNKEYDYLKTFLALSFAELRELGIYEHEIRKLKEEVTKKYIRSLTGNTGFSR